MSLLIPDLVVADIDRDVTCWEPERGGALMGPVGLDAVSRFIFDEDARATRGTYEPSTTLRDLVRQIERGENLRYVGLAHSQPGGLDRLSGQDRHELSIGLERNLHMGEYLAPVVTANAGPPTGAHEVGSDHGKISFFSATRGGGAGRQVDIAEVPVRIVPIGAALKRAAMTIGRDQIPRPRELEVDGMPFLATTAEDSSGSEWSFLLPWHLDMCPPVVMRNAVQLSLPWDLRKPVAERLACAIERALDDERRRLRWKRLPAPQMLDDAVRLAGGLGALAVRGVESVVARGVQAARHKTVVPARDRFARTATILPLRHAASRRVLIVGLGSVGSRIAEELARTGIGALTLVDPQRVEAANLSRTAYRVRDVGLPKVDALASVLSAAAPGIALRRRMTRVDAAAEDWLRGAMMGMDLVVAATDDPAAQLIVNRLAAEAGVPSLYIGLTAGARGGEVLVVSPGRTPCYACALTARQAQPRDLRPEMDYGAARLDGELALGCDIAHVSTAAARIALSVLAPSGSRLAEFAERVVADETTYLTLGMTPEYWFFPTLFERTRAQYAFQSAWLTPIRRPDCPVCGDGSSVGSGVRPSLAALRSIAVPDHPTTQPEEVSP